MDTIVPGVVLKENKAQPPRKMKEIKKRRGRKIVKFESYLSEGYSPKKSMELAGYSPLMCTTKVAATLRLVNYDTLRLALKPHAVLLNHQANGVMQRMMEHGVDIKQQAYGAKLALDNAKIHLADDKSPTSITFSFQTIQAENVQVNVGEAVEDAPVKEIKGGDGGEHG